MPVPGQVYILYLNFYNEQSGVLTDPASVQLDITYGGQVGFVPDVAGPFTYSGASSLSTTQVWRIGTGQYAFAWAIPSSALSGVYVANWTTVFGADTLLGAENFTVTGGAVPVPVTGGDTGYWTGGLIYGGQDIEFGTADPNGITWLWQKLDGWDGPDTAGGVLQKAGDHGAWPSPQFFQARTMTWTVTASAPTQALRDTARALLSQALPVSDLATLRYDEPVPKVAYVRRSGRVTETYPALADVTFTIGLVAPDPRKYSAQQHSTTVNATGGTGTGFTLPFTLPLTPPAQAPPGTAALVNAGSFETRPVITVAGPVTSPAVANVTTGQAVSWTGLVLAATDKLVIDFGLRQGLLNGAFRPADPQSAWWNLPPGTSTVQLAGQNSAGASMQITWRDAWA